MIDTKITKKRIILTSIAFVIAVFTAIMLGRIVELAPIWCAALFVFILLRFKFNDKLAIIADVLFPCAAAFFSAYFSVFSLFVKEDGLKEYKSLFSYFHAVSKADYCIEFLIPFALYFVFRAFIKDRRLAATLAPVLPLLLGLLDYYVFAFRGNEVNAGDITSIKTAMNVAGQYNFLDYIPICYLILPYVLYVFACYSFDGLVNDQKILKRIAPAVLICLACFMYGQFQFMNWTSAHAIFLWSNEGSRYNGMITNILMTVKSLHPNEPYGYSIDAFNNEFSNFEYVDNGRRPNIIIIMNESFTDVTVYNDFYEDSFADPLPYFHSLAEDFEHARVGYAYSSVTGGGTSISEFEMLTGITDAYLPPNASPYMLYVRRNTYSIPWALKSLGYDTIAMHPYDSSGWNRINAYPYMGFDQMLFIEDFEYTDDDLMRTYMSDTAAYRNLINVIENHDSETDAPLFTFLITMQNHGGYGQETVDIDVTNYSGEGNNKENLFMTLLKHSDDALEYLIEYLENQDEEYVLMMFGDHHPHIPSLTPALENAGRGWIVPYVIWSNRGLDENYQVFNDPNGFTSLNYIGMETLIAADISLPYYFQYVQMIQHELPLMQSNNFYSYDDGEYHYIYHYEYDTPVGSAILRYRYLQYFSLFEGDNTNEYINFP